MITLSDAIKRVEPSPTLAASARAKELKAEGRDVIAFTVGEPDFDTPDHVKEAAKAALDNGYTKYTVVGGIPELKSAIISKFERDQKVNYKPEQIIVTNGGKHALAALFAVLLNDGDEVVVPAPYWTSYPDMVRLSGGTPVVVSTKPENGLLMTPEELKQACTSKTRAIIINSPSNPTGACYSKEQLVALGEVVKTLPNASNLLVVSDEVYEYITYDGFTHTSFISAVPELKENTVVINAFSKAYAMTGWRVGFAAGPDEIIKAMSKHQSQFSSNAQYAAVVAYDDGYAFPKKMKGEFIKRREIVCNFVEKTKGLGLSAKPLGAFYAFIDVSGVYGKSFEGKSIDSSADFADALLDNFDVVVVPGEAFGAPGAFRLSFALSTEQLEKGLARIGQFVSQLS